MGKNASKSLIAGLVDGSVTVVRDCDDQVSFQVTVDSSATPADRAQVELVLSEEASRALGEALTASGSSTPIPCSVGVRRQLRSDC